MNRRILVSLQSASGEALAWTPAALLWFAAIALWMPARCAHATFPSQTFDTDAQSWTVVGSATDYGPPTQLSGPFPSPWDARGNPGGALSIGDSYYATWISAPAPFLGNQSNMFGQSFTYDLFVRYADATDNHPYPSIAIRSGTTNLLYTIATPPLFQWDRRIVTFNPALWTVDEGSASPTPGPVATQAQLQSALSNLEGLYILTEWRTGPDDTSVDNVGVGFSTAGVLQGDYNKNGVVDAADYVLWRNELGNVFSPTDYIIWRSNFGRTSGAGSAATAFAASAVPEPNSLMIACSIAGALFAFARIRC